MKLLFYCNLIYVFQFYNLTERHKLNHFLNYFLNVSVQRTAAAVADMLKFRKLFMSSHAKTDSKCHWVTDYLYYKTFIHCGTVGHTHCRFSASKYTENFKL